MDSKIVDRHPDPPAIRQIPRPPQHRRHGALFLELSSFGVDLRREFSRSDGEERARVAPTVEAEPRRIETEPEVLRRIILNSEDGVKEFLSRKEALSACDVAVFVHDSSRELSWQKATDMLVDVASQGEATGYEVPCLIVAAKDDLDPHLTEIQDSTRLELPLPWLGWLLTGRYAIEDHFWKNLFNSSFVTTHPNQARLVFIPFSFHTMRRKIFITLFSLQIKSNKQVTSLLGTYVEGLIHKCPYWNKIVGLNHFLFTCFGVDINATRVILLMAQNSIRIMCASYYSAGFISQKDISIPSALRPFLVPFRRNATENRYKEATQMLDHMSCRGIEADVFTCNVLVDDLCKNNKSAKGYLLLKKMRERKVVPNEVTYNNLINGFVKEGKFAVAGRIYDEMSFGLVNDMEEKGLRPNEVTYGTLLNGLCKHGKMGDVNEAIKIYTVMLRSEAMEMRGDGLKAFEMLDEMVKLGIRTSCYTYGSLLKGLCKGGYLKEAFQFFGKLRKMLNAMDIAVFNTVLAEIFIDACSRAGQLDKLNEILWMMDNRNLSPNLVTYNILLHGQSARENISGSWNLYKTILRKGFVPDKFTCHSLIIWLCKSGMLDIGTKFLKTMIMNGNFVDQLTFDMLLEMYSQRGEMSRSFKFVENYEVR
ncbi:pentatricopeptide repeat-containing protein at5g55840 [Phtheirospermum japonicum]|uniref:Pentatricopeptide repeat-containing protein at5g55840 n=1 Tax=Phtheirospermum japonicum TaxID=374723 RepID=A0A830BC32_9LAMI|nr:pentatricopeptide repeat-containing protein at5g55840 [Phtheirospermum japonicum]